MSRNFNLFGVFLLFGVYLAFFHLAQIDSAVPTSKARFPANIFMHTETRPFFKSSIGFLGCYGYNQSPNGPGRGHNPESSVLQ